MIYLNLHHNLRIVLNALTDNRFHRTVRTDYHHLVILPLGEQISIAYRQGNRQIVAVKAGDCFSVGGYSNLGYAGVGKQTFRCATQVGGRLCQSVSRACLNVVLLEFLIFHIQANIYAAGLFGNRLQYCGRQIQAALPAVHIQVHLLFGHIVEGINRQA